MTLARRSGKRLACPPTTETAQRGLHPVHRAGAYGEAYVTLYGDYLGNDHRRMHKWYHYYAAYESHFARFRNRHITVFEIGVGEGGSLEQWRGYFGPFATIVGIDIYPRCRQLQSEQIHIRIGSQADIGFLAGIVEEFGPPDIVIDDGSHLQHHINATFDFLYPHVAKNGVYIVEDLHAAYWPNHGGGLRRSGSFIETAKGLIDQMHAHYIGDGATRTLAGDRTTSVHFYDSVVVFDVGEPRKMGNKTTGQSERFDNRWAPDGVDSDQFARLVDETLKDIEKEGPEWEAGYVADDRDAQIRQLNAEVARLRGSTSWRMTRPVRTIGRLLRRAKRD